MSIVKIETPKGRSTENKGIKMSFQTLYIATDAVRRAGLVQRLADRLGMAVLLLIGLATAGATALVGV